MCHTDCIVVICRIGRFAGSGWPRPPKSYGLTTGILPNKPTNTCSKPAKLPKPIQPSATLVYMFVWHSQVSVAGRVVAWFGANGWCKVRQPVWIGLVAKPTIMAQQWCKACTQTRHSRKVHRPVHWHMYTPSEAGSWQVNPDVMCHCQLTIRVDNIYSQTRLDLMNSHKMNARCATRRKVHRDACFEL